MSRTESKRFVPFCETQVFLGDQYMWPEKDTQERICHNGVSHPIYNCQGEISRTLPLDMYPRVNEVHPQVRGALPPHFGSRDPMTRRAIQAGEQDIREGRIEGFYVNGGPTFDAHANLADRIRRNQMESIRGARASAPRGRERCCQ